ncbi:winged helix-turn-helix domain-containing protein [Nocardioides sp. W7]|uniref:response regulator transcription factor n=1 Tax=Nocardioides sp. W7 TaxID=2931390 RepID=UPI001FD45237|nr:winged helix-turn-helix domain-containing protein [Nocardioides sp. W7]
MTAELGMLPLAEREQELPPRQAGARASNQHWTEATGAQLLVVDPFVDHEQLAEDMSTRGVHVTCVGSTLDALIEFGRLRPTAVVVAPETPGLPAVDFVRKVREYGPTFVVAALDRADAPEAGPLLLAGAGAAMTRPYTAETVWDILDKSGNSFDDHAKVSFGPIELDTRAYLVRINGERIADLPLKEFELLRTLMYSAPEVLSNDELRLSLWGDTHAGPADNTISVHVARLRNRLQGIARIRRIRGRGYSLTLGS